MVGRLNLATSMLLADERMRGPPAVVLGLGKLPALLPVPWLAQLPPGGLCACRSCAPSQMACSSSSSSSNCLWAGWQTSLVPSAGLWGCGDRSAHSKTESCVGAAGEAGDSLGWLLLASCCAQAGLGMAPALPGMLAGDDPSSSQAAL